MDAERVYDGRHDFDFVQGRWVIANTKLATLRARRVIGGTSA